MPRKPGSAKLKVDKKAHGSISKLNTKHQKLISQHIPIGIVECSLDGRYLDVNEEFCLILGYDREELLQRGIKDVTYEEDYHLDIKLHNQLIAGEIPYYKIEKRCVRKNGRIVWAELTRSLVRDSSGAPLYTVGMVLDITERQRAEEALMNARVRAEKTTHRIARLQQITAALSGAATTRQLAEMILEQGTKAAEVSAGILVELLENGQQIRTLAALGYPEAVVRIEPVPLAERTPMSNCILERQAIWIRSHQEFTIQYPDLAKRLADFGNEATAALPLIVGDHVLGGLAFSFDNVQVFDKEEREFFLAVAQQCAQALERARSEDALRQSEERFVRFMQQLPGLAWIKDEHGRYLYANNSAQEAFGTTQQKLYGRTDEEIFAPETAAQFRQNDERALLEGKGIQVIETLKHESGVLHSSLVSKFPIPGPDGQRTLIGGVAFDITERLEVQEALRESEERFRAIISQATAGIVRKAYDGTLTFVNQAFCNMLGYTSAELVGITCWQLTYKDDVEENKRLFERLMKDGIPFQMERRLLRRDGSILWSNLSVSPIMDATGRPQSAVGVEVDITARKQAEEALQQLNLQLESRVEQRTAELQATNQALRENRRRLQVLSQRLVAVQEEERRAIARELHDRVGQSLAALNLNLTIIKGQMAGQASEQVSLRLADSMKLVAEVITLVRSVMSNLRPTILDDYGVEAALQSYLEDYQARYGIHVTFGKPNPALPRLDPSTEVTLLRIGQEALINIARHAQATEVSLSLRQEPQSICLIIEDNGIGIPSLDKRDRPGSHGMKIMHERAEALEGTLTITSVPGKGTRVEAVLPLSQSRQNEVSQEQ